MTQLREAITTVKESPEPVDHLATLDRLITESAHDSREYAALVEARKALVEQDAAPETPEPVGEPVSEPLPSPTPARPDAVAMLLAESLAAHASSKALRAGGSSGQAHAELVRAAMKRVEASDIDPERLSLAWRDEQSRTSGRGDTHASLMAFYRRQGVI